MPITDDELADMPLPTAKAIDVVAFVPREEIAPIRRGQSYYLEAASEVAAKPYTLLGKALERSDKVAIAKYALRGRERLGVLSIREGALTLHQRHCPTRSVTRPSSLPGRSTWAFVIDPAVIAPQPRQLQAQRFEVRFRREDRHFPIRGADPCPVGADLCPICVRR